MAGFGDFMKGFIGSGGMENLKGAFGKDNGNGNGGVDTPSPTVQGGGGGQPAGGRPLDCESGGSGISGHGFW